MHALSICLSLSLSLTLSHTHTHTHTHKHTHTHMHTRTHEHTHTHAQHTHTHTYTHTTSYTLTHHTSLYITHTLAQTHTYTLYSLVISTSHQKTGHAHTGQRPVYTQITTPQAFAHHEPYLPQCMVLSICYKQQAAIAGNTLWGIEPSVLQTAVLKSFLLSPNDHLWTNAYVCKIWAAGW